MVEVELPEVSEECREAVEKTGDSMESGSLGATVEDLEGISISSCASDRARRERKARKAADIRTKKSTHPGNAPSDEVLPYLMPCSLSGIICTEFFV